MEQDLERVPGGLELPHPFLDPGNLVRDVGIVGVLAHLIELSFKLNDRLLEIEVVQVDDELIASRADGLIDRLARELPVGTHLASSPSAALTTTLATPDR